MKRQFSFLIELAKQQFDEGENNTSSSWIMAMPLGTYQHPAYGKINITLDRVKQFADNVNNSIRGQQLDIDYDHKEYGGEAAGWVERAEARPDGLWILVEWTKKAYEAIKSKAYRYFSPEFQDTWIHPSTGEKFKDVLFGGGITNRPFLKGIQPLNLSEFYDEKVALKENGNMDPEQVRELAAKLGLGEDATPEMLFGALMMKLGGGDKPEPPKEPEPPKPETKPEEEKKPMEEEETLTAQLSEHPLIKKLTEKLEAQSKALKEREVASTVQKLNETATAAGRILAPTIETGVTKLLSESASDEYTEVLTKVLSEIISDIGPASGELGGNNKPSVNADGVKKFSDAVDKLVKDKGISFAEAAVLAAAEDESGFESYRAGSYIREDV